MEEVTENCVLIRCNGALLRTVIPLDIEVATGEQIHLSIRPEDIAVSQTQPGGPNVFSGSVQEIVFVGHAAKAIVELEFGSRIIADVPTHLATSLDLKEIFVSWKPEDSVIAK